MHWALLAQKDHKDINLSSLRMLLVADGANPCKSDFKIMTHLQYVRDDMTLNKIFYSSALIS